MKIFKIHHKKLNSILILLIFCSCKQNFEKVNTEINTPEKWETININENIIQNEVYKKMNKEKEVYSVFERDTLRKKTSDVAYINNRNPNYDMKKYSKKNNCRSYYYKKDTLSINIGIGNGFGGSGFVIFVKNNKFYTKPYYSTDVIIEGEKESTYKIIYQKLILNKLNFKIGDSIYGKIEFKSIEIDNQNNKINHDGNGYFRTKVEEF